MGGTSPATPPGATTIPRRRVSGVLPPPSGFTKERHHDWSSTRSLCRLRGGGSDPCDGLRLPQVLLLEFQQLCSAAVLRFVREH